MNKLCDVVQMPGGDWHIHVRHESGLVQAIPIGIMSKEQAVRETVRRGYTDVRVWDKEVLKEVHSGDAHIDRSVYGGNT